MAAPQARSVPAAAVVALVMLVQLALAGLLLRASELGV
jgi:hypothetical protein